MLEFFPNCFEILRDRTLTRSIYYYTSADVKQNKTQNSELQFIYFCRKIMTRRCKQRLAHYVKRDNIKMNNILVWIAHVTKMSKHELQNCLPKVPA